MIPFLVMFIACAIFAAGPLALLALLLKVCRVRSWHRVLQAAGLLLIVVPASFVWSICNPRTVVQAFGTDGTELRVVQRCTWDADMFNTAVYYRRPGGQWGWFYYDHQDDLWRRGRAVVDPQLKRISIYRENKVTATFDWETERFRLLRDDFPHREFLGAQERIDPPA